MVRIKNQDKSELINQSGFGLVLTILIILDILSDFNLKLVSGLSGFGDEITNFRSGPVQPHQQVQI
jgi:hypothetical protein